MTFRPNFTIKDLLDHNVHFGHKKNLWNPKMEKYIYGIKDNIHIINLKETAISLYSALRVVYSVAAQKGKILFINTKKQSAATIKNEAERCNQFYINNRWLGGMLTNWKTVSSSIKTLNHYETLCTKQTDNYTKKEILTFKKKKDKLNRNIGGIKHMGGLPDLLFVIDVKTHHIALKEASIKDIPVIAVVDTNSSPDDIHFVIPGNDDSRKSIDLYCKLVANAIIDGSKSTTKNLLSNNKITNTKNDK